MGGSRKKKWAAEDESKRHREKNKRQRPEAQRGRRQHNEEATMWKESWVTGVGREGKMKRVKIDSNDILLMHVNSVGKQAWLRVPQRLAPYPQKYQFKAQSESPLKKMYLWKHVLHVYLRLYVEIYIAFEYNKFATFLTKIAIPPISNVVNAVVMNILSGLRNISVHLDWSLSLLHLRLVQLIALNAHLIALNTACDYNKSMKRCVASHYTAFKSKSIKLPFKHTVYWSGLYQSIWNIDRNQVDIIKNMPNSLTLRILA